MTASAISEYRQTRTAGLNPGDDPHRTVLLLLQGAIERVRSADAAIQQGAVQTKLTAIRQTLDILDVLRASLDHQAGGPIAGGLDSLYEYVSQRLVQANAVNNREHLAEAARLLSEIATAWAEVPARLGDQAKA
ncbi:MAG TPA: flagellar export chaperone FliS [Arenimonas sp.]|nr:flagellar export chaperone FliS [Arenimonas sp.]